MRFVYLILLCIVVACNSSETFNFEIQTVKPIKSTDLFGKTFFDAWVLTPERYSRSGQRHQIDVGFISEGIKGGVTIEMNVKKGELIFKNKGEASDFFVTTMAQLYEATLEDYQMKEEVYFTFVPETMAGKEILQDEIILNLHHPRVDIILLIDIPQGTIKFLEKTMGLNKENLIQVFRKQ